MLYRDTRKRVPERPWHRIPAKTGVLFPPVFAKEPLIHAPRGPGKEPGFTRSGKIQWDGSGRASVGRMCGKRDDFLRLQVPNGLVIEAHYILEDLECVLADPRRRRVEDRGRR